MKLPPWLQLSNGKARVFVGVLLAGLACFMATRSTADATTTEYVKTLDRGDLAAGSQDLVKELERLAREDPIALLELCARN